MTKQTFLLLTPDELSQIAKDCRGVEGEHFLPHTYGNAVQMALLKKNNWAPETISIEIPWYPEEEPDGWTEWSCVEDVSPSELSPNDYVITISDTERDDEFWYDKTARKTSDLPWDVIVAYKKIST